MVEERGRETEREREGEREGERERRESKERAREKRARRDKRERELFSGFFCFLFHHRPKERREKSRAQKL